jgi:hypothetical protein
MELEYVVPEPFAAVFQELRFLFGLAKETAVGSVTELPDVP